MHRAAKKNSFGSNWRGGNAYIDVKQFSETNSFIETANRAFILFAETAKSNT